MVSAESVEGPRGVNPAMPSELEQVIGLVDAAMRKGSDQTMRSDYPLVYAPENLGNVQAVFVDGRAVATAPVLPKRVLGDGIDVGLGIISPTATDPPYQHRGYGPAASRRVSAGWRRWICHCRRSGRWLRHSPSTS